MKGRYRCFILLDTLMSLFLAGLVLAVVFLSISLGLKYSADTKRRSDALLRVMNRYEEEKQVIYTSE